MNTATHQEQNIPTLTEIIAIENESESVAAPKKETAPPVQTSLIPDFSLDELEKNLQEKVLRQLLTRVDFVLEHRIRDGLAEALQNATDDLVKDIRQGLYNSLGELIHRTISQEISKIQSTKSQK